MSYIDYVYPTQGSDSMPHFSKGNTLPQVSMPWGYNSWVPQTQLLEGESKNWFYSPHSSNFYGLRCSHQPSPWIGDYAAFLMMPQTGEKIRDVPHLGRSGFDPQRTIIKPNLFKTYLSQSNCLFSFSPGYTSGIGNLKFDRKNVEKRLMFYPYENIQGGEHYPGMNAISFNVDHKVPRSVVNNFPLHSYLVFDCDFEFHELENKQGYYISFPANVQTISFKIATSFIDVEQAFHNINYELRDYSIDDVIQWNANEWNNLLGRIDVPNIDEDKKKTFYSCLYRSLLFPKKLHEINPEGEKVHRSPFDGSIHEGPFVAENGFWDTYRTVYPLLSLVYADHLSEIIRGWVNACEEGGWSPKWSAPGYTDCMIGTHLDVVFADAMKKDIPFDYALAYKYSLQNCFKESSDPGSGRTGLGDYINLGYVPEDKVLHGASRTLDFCYNDWAVSVMADHLGDTESSAKLKDRLSNYYNIWDSEQLHFRGKDSNGSWSEDFDAYRWGGAYVEGSAWQCGWAVYHEPEKLIDLIGGNEATIRRLDQMLGDQPYYETGHYPCEIHEMSEMAAMDFGQYGHNNQPSHHILYFYHLAGAPQKGNHYIHRVLDECYSHRIDGFCGDEDNGEMAAWYILNCLGLYQFCPGSTRFIKAEPYFDKISLYFDNGKTLTIERSSGHAQTTLNGEPIEMMFEYHDLRKGGQLYFE